MIYVVKLSDGRALAYNSLDEVESFERGWRKMLSGSDPAKRERSLAEMQARNDGRSIRKDFADAKFEDTVRVFAMSGAQLKLLRQAPLKTERPKPTYFLHKLRALPKPRHQKAAGLPPAPT